MKYVQGERRQFRRAPVDGTAVMWFDDATASRYRLADISTGGCQLMKGPLRPVGEHVAAVINIADRRPVAIPARVVRHVRVADGTTGLGLAFHDRDPNTRAYLREVTSTHDEVQSISQTDCVLVVHAERRTRRVLSDTLERLGYDVIAVSTPFEAIWALEHQGGRISAILVSARLETSDPNDLLRFIARRYPRVKRVLMPSNPGDCPANDVHPEVDHVVMDEPWDVWSLFAEMRE